MPVTLLPEVSVASPVFVTITGSLPGTAGDGPEPPVVTFTPSGWLPDPAAGLLFPPSPQAVRIFGGTFSVALLATDSTATSWTWQARFTGLPNVTAYAFSFALPSNAASFTATNASPCVFTAAGTAYANGQALTLAGASLPAGFTAGTVYYVTGVSGTSFSLAATTGGTALASTSTGSGSVVPAVDISALATVPSVTPTQQYLPLPSGTPSPGQVPVATGTGEGSAWTSVGGTGTVTSVSVATANGFAGTVATPTTTPAVTVQTTVTGLLKGNGTAVSAATAGTDYAPATSGSAILKGNGSGGFSAAAAGTDYLAPSGSGAALTGITAPQVGGGAFPAYVAPHVVTLTDGSSVALDASAGNDFRWSLGGSSHTLAAPSNPVNGQSITIAVKYTGSFTPLFNAVFDFGSAGQPAWTAASGKTDYAGFRYDSALNAAAGAWAYMGSVLGLTS
jgi:hypothetical protein